VSRYASAGGFRGRKPPDAAARAGFAGRRQKLGAAQPLIELDRMERASASERTNEVETASYFDLKKSW